ncbi:MAG: tetratricopeptide repeat protein [Kiloniellales bacterium]
MPTAADRQGLAMTGADATCAALYDRGTEGFLCYNGDPIGGIKQALEQRPDFVMGYLFIAMLNLTGMEPQSWRRAAKKLDQAEALEMNSRERQHLAAARAFGAGDFSGALAKLEALLLEWPRDILALQVGQILDFYCGDVRSMRDRVARRMHAWSRNDASYHGVLGLHAFGLEECGLYRHAEDEGQAAVGLNPENGWAVHAVAHVYEMESRPEAGLAWLRGTQEGWTRENFFQMHNWWHMALCHLERDEDAAALALYDGPIMAARNGVILEQADAASLLWRLRLRGTDVGARWQAVAEAWLPFVEEDIHAFNTAHGVMAFLADERPKDLQALLGKMEAAAAGESDNGRMERLVGLPLAKGLIAFEQGRYEESIEHLAGLRSTAQLFGGSHAQRDIIDLTLLEASKRAGQQSLLKALVSERAALRPDSGWVRRYLSALTVTAEPLTA